MIKELRLPLVVRLTFVLLFLWLSFYMLSEFRNYLYPIALGILFAYLLYPLAYFLERRGLHRILSNLLSIVVGIAVVSFVTVLIYKQFQLFLTDLPSLKERAALNIHIIFKQIEMYFGVKAGDFESTAKNMVMELLSSPARNFSSTVGSTFTTFFTLFIMPVYVFFLLFYRNKFKQLVLMMVAEEKHELAQRIITDVSKVAVRYMTGIFIVVAILVVVNSAGFLIIGLHHALLLGLIAALMNFIPYYGTIIGYAFPLFFSMVVMDSPTYAFLVLLQFIIVQFTENNILTPNIVGAHVNINPFMIILGITLGGFVWGLPGMFIAVPVFAMLRVVGDHIDRLKPLAFLLGQEGAEEHSISAQKISNFFRKLTNKKHPH